MSTGFNIQLEMGDPLATLGDLTGLEFPKMSREVQDVSSWDSPNGYKEFVSEGLKDAGEMSVTLKWRDGTTGADLAAAFESGALTPFQITTTHETPVTLSFNGLVKSHEPATPEGDSMTKTFTIKLSGAPVWG